MKKYALFITLFKNYYTLKFQKEQVVAKIKYNMLLLAKISPGRQHYYIFLADYNKYIISIF